MKVMASFILTLLVQGTAFGYANCPDHVSQYIQNSQDPTVHARIVEICRRYDPMTIICGLDFRHVLPSLMRTPDTYLMAIDTCKHESHEVLMCTLSTLEKGPRNAEPSALQATIKQCFE